MMGAWIPRYRSNLELDRSGFAVYREGVQKGQNPVLTEHSFRDGTISHMENFFECIKTRKEPTAPVETGLPPREPATSATWLTTAVARVYGRRRTLEARHVTMGEKHSGALLRRKPRAAVPTSPNTIFSVSTNGRPSAKCQLPSANCQSLLRGVRACKILQPHRKAERTLRIWLVLSLLSLSCARV